MKRSEKLPILFRDPHPADLNFIFNSWLQSFKGSKVLDHISQEFYYQGQHQVIERILRQANIKMLVNSEQTEDIYGYIIFEEIEGIFVMHYAYLKQTFRYLGLFRRMLNEFKPGEGAGFYTHNSKCAYYVGQKFNLFYNPYILHRFLKPLPDQFDSAKKQEVEK